jgi:glutamine synthetase type III
MLNCQSNTALAEELSAIIKKIEDDSDKAIELNKEVLALVTKVYYKHPTLSNA